MKVGVLSDAHGNLLGLQLCLDYLINVEKVEKIYFLGDAVGYLPEYSEVTDLLRSTGAICIMGNHDAMLLGHLELNEEKDKVYRIEENRSALNSKQLDYLNSWPRKLESRIGDKSVMFVHGSPTDYLNGYIYPDSDLQGIDQLNVNTLFMGQTHHPFIKKIAGTLVINPGSCGLPRDHGGLASCATYNSIDQSAKIIRIPMDIAEIHKKYGNKIHSSVVDCLMRKPESEIFGEVIDQGKA